MAVFARPDGDITNTGFAGGWADLDEETASDADYWSGDNNAADELEVSLSTVADPGVSTGHIIRYRAAKGDTDGSNPDGGGNAVQLLVRLMQGTTEIVAAAGEMNVALDGTWTTHTHTLSVAQTDSITNYPDLRLEFVTSASGGSPANRRCGLVSWAELEVPSGSTQFNQGIDATTTVTPAVADAVTFTKALPALSTVTPEMARLSAFLVAVAATSVVTAAFVRQIGLGVSAVTTVSAGLARRMFVSLEAASTVVAALVALKLQFVTLAATTVVAAEMATVAAFQRTLAVASTAVPAMVRQVGLTLAVPVSVAVSLTKQMFVELALPVTVTVGYLRDVALTFAATTAVAVEQIESYIKSQALAATSAVTPALAHEVTFGGGPGGAVRRFLFKVLVLLRK